MKGFWQIVFGLIGWYLIITIFGIDDWAINKLKKNNDFAYITYAENDIKKSIRLCYQMDIDKNICDVYAAGRRVQLSSELDKLFSGKYDSYANLLAEQGELVARADKAVRVLGYDKATTEFKKDKALCKVYNTLSKQLGNNATLDCDDYPDKLSKAEDGTWGFIMFLVMIK